MIRNQWSVIGDAGTILAPVTAEAPPSLSVTVIPLPNIPLPFRADGGGGEDLDGTPGKGGYSAVAWAMPRSAAVQMRSSSFRVMANGGMITTTLPKGLSQTPSVRAWSQTR